MEVIRNAAKTELSYLGEQIINHNLNYRPIIYSMNVKLDNGLLIYNNLTDELIFLNQEEQKALNETKKNSETLQYLIKRWFFVPNNYDDIQLCNNLNNFMHFIVNQVSENIPITRYTIFTTTDCNARCFYCYELGRKRINMSDSVAKDSVNYIKKSAKDNSVTLRWFGGEPLCNSRAIDIICSELRKQGVVFTSSMVTNGYLFDVEAVQKAKKNWLLKKVQITLDGTEQIYNNVKKYIYEDENPFLRVMENIKLLLEADIKVTIRINVDKHNIEDSFELVEKLDKCFGEYINFKVYAHLLFDNTPNKETKEKEQSLLDAYEKLTALIMEKGLDVKYTLNNYLRYRQCMADSEDATVILPDGHLGRCEHFSDNEFWGNIYSKEIDSNVIKRFKKVRMLPQKCDYCPIRPACIQLEMCPDLPENCNDYYQRTYLKNVKRRIVNTFYDYKKSKK